MASAVPTGGTTISNLPNATELNDSDEVIINRDGKACRTSELVNSVIGLKSDVEELNTNKADQTDVDKLETAVDELNSDLTDLSTARIEVPASEVSGLSAFDLYTKMVEYVHKNILEDLTRFNGYIRVDDGSTGVIVNGYKNSSNSGRYYVFRISSSSEAPILVRITDSTSTYEALATNSDLTQLGDDLDSINIFGNGITIPDGDDLDDYRAGGHYRSEGSSIGNSPISGTFALYVFHLRSSSQVLQILIPPVSVVTFYVRYGTSSQWYGWRQITTASV